MEVAGSEPVIRETLPVVLVEAGDLNKVRNWNEGPSTFSNRVSSITNASQSFLGEIGAWAHVDEGRTCPIEEMQVWDGVSDARITFSMQDDHASILSTEPEAQLARLTENLNLQRGLLRYLDESGTVELADKVKVQSIVREEREGGGWPLVHLSDGRVLRASQVAGESSR
uniref:Mitogen-activated protein kinase (EC) n=1 Tax=Ganoderma boninense TaxID=34458 RepID=A0A5K1K373_9APHY|nr:Mitogen-activated protein kinase (EC [Ganoderma boninense]